MEEKTSLDVTLLLHARSFGCPPREEYEFPVVQTKSGSSIVWIALALSIVALVPTLRKK